MSNAVEFPSLSLVEPDSGAPQRAAGPHMDAPASAPAAGPMGRRWSDGAGTYVSPDPNAPWSMTQQWPNLVAALSEQAGAAPKPRP